MAQKHHTRRAFAALASAVALLSFVPAFAQAPQATPAARPITVLVGFSAGGNPDVAMRHLARRLSERLDQPVVVENRPGAAGTIAASTAARAAPDGHTLLFGVAANLAVAPAAMAKAPYDPATASTPIVEVARGPYLLLVRAELPVQNAREFVALFANWGIATTGGTAEAFGRLIASESSRWSAFVARLGSKLE